MGNFPRWRSLFVTVFARKITLLLLSGKSASCARKLETFSGSWIAQMPKYAYLRCFFPCYQGKRARRLVRTLVHAPPVFSRTYTEPTENILTRLAVSWEILFPLRAVTDDDLVAQLARLPSGFELSFRLPSDGFDLCLGHDHAGIFSQKETRRK